SRVKAAHGGVILRLKPDASGAEIIADCFRNAYDFDFDERGEVFAYDSDGERDISLPWYMPTRLFHVVPGGSHGWISENCKHPDYFLDAAPVVVSTGRGSPAGVVCYRHTQFPEEYRGGLFILDWTVGRGRVGCHWRPTWEARHFCRSRSMRVSRLRRGFARLKFLLICLPVCRELPPRFWRWSILPNCGPARSGRWECVRRRGCLPP